MNTENQHESTTEENSAGLKGDKVGFELRKGLTVSVNDDVRRGRFRYVYQVKIEKP